jgi:hypothetical protein
MLDGVLKDIKLCIHVNTVRQLNHRSTYLEQGYLSVSHPLLLHSEVTLPDTNGRGYNDDAKEALTAPLWLF